MIAIPLQGGLGNQMFQYAAARRLSLRLSSPLVLDVDWYIPPKRHTRPFELLNFALADDEGVQASRGAVDEAEADQAKRLYRENQPGFADEVLGLADGVVLKGFFQSYRYFEDVEDQIRKDFRLRDGDREARVRGVVRSLRREGRPLVSVHIRRGDYVTLRPDDGLVVPVSRLKDAMARFAGAEFLVFSDDLAWCAEHLDGPGVHVSPLESAIDDLVAMAACDHHIIANSSFSWWGAWLNPSPTKTVLYPTNWHNGQWPKRSAEDQIRDAMDLIPPPWIAY